MKDETEVVKPKWIAGAIVDGMLGSCRSRKYALMKAPLDPFPKPFRIGRSRRWSESEVIAWMVRQEARRNTTGEAEMEAESAEPSVSEGDAVLLPKLKLEYEAGASLDALCRRYQLGKLRLSKILRTAGAVMRAPGRKSSSGQNCYGRDSKLNSSEGHYEHPQT